MAANILTWWWLWRHPGAEWRHYYLHPCRYLKFGKNSVLCKQCNVLKWKKPFAGFGFVLLTQSKKKNSRNFDPAWFELTNPNMTLTWNCQTLVFAWFVRQTIVWISKTSINNYWREVALAKHYILSKIKDICLRHVLRSKKTLLLMYYTMLSLQLRWTTKHLFFVLEFNATFTCDNSMEMFADGQSLGTDSNWENATTYLVSGNTRVLSVAGIDLGGNFGILGSMSNGLVTDESWKCSSFPYPGWNFPDFDDQGWHSASVIANHGDNPWKTIDGIATAAKWIWANNKSKTAYCRLNIK